MSAPARPGGGVATTTKVAKGDDEPFNHVSFETMLDTFASEQEARKEGILVEHDQDLGDREITLYQRDVDMVEEDIIVT